MKIVVVVDLEAEPTRDQIIEAIEKESAALHAMLTGPENRGRDIHRAQAERICNLLEPQLVYEISRFASGPTQKRLLDWLERTPDADARLRELSERLSTREGRRIVDSLRIAAAIPDLATATGLLTSLWRG